MPGVFHMVQPVAQSWQSFGPDGQMNDQAVAAQLRALGAEVIRAARCDGQFSVLTHENYAS